MEPVLALELRVMIAECSPAVWLSFIVADKEMYEYYKTFKKQKKLVIKKFSTLVVNEIGKYNKEMFYLLPCGWIHGPVYIKSAFMKGWKTKCWFSFNRLLNGCIGISRNSRVTIKEGKIYRAMIVYYRGHHFNTINVEFENEMPCRVRVNDLGTVTWYEKDEQLPELCKVLVDNLMSVWMEKYRMLTR